ncbi:MAG: M16 family metallopeptidase, partial [Myxococcota bacterium]
MNAQRLTPVMALLLSACPAPDAPELDPVVPGLAEAVAHDPTKAREKPDPLPMREFKTPTTESRTLSNGLRVVVATNTEVPLVNITMAFNVGDFAADVPDLASTTFDMMNEGAGDLSAADISRKLKAMASDLNTSASMDGATVSAQSLKKNLEPTLDLMALVIEEPTFPADEWTILQRRYVAGVQQARKDPNGIASRVQGRVLYGNTYSGRIAMESTYQAMTPEQMKAWHAKYVGPQNAVILVGGDVSADEIMPILEARFGDWAPEGIESPTVAPTVVQPEKPVLYFVNKPGAAQSVVRVFNVVGQRTDSDWFAYDLGMDVLGGTFMSRVNMNLREDKGYTYGARCRTGMTYGDKVSSCSAGVKTEETGN